MIIYQYNKRYWRTWSYKSSLRMISMISQLEVDRILFYCSMPSHFTTAIRVGSLSSACSEITLTLTMLFDASHFITAIRGWFMELSLLWGNSYLNNPIVVRCHGHVRCRQPAIDVSPANNIFRNGIVLFDLSPFAVIFVFIVVGVLWLLVGRCASGGPGSWFCCERRSCWFTTS